MTDQLNATRYLAAKRMDQKRFEKTLRSDVPEREMQLMINRWSQYYDAAADMLIAEQAEQDRRAA